MWSRVQVKTAGALPLAAADLRARLRIDDTGEDDLLEAFLAAAAAEIEGPDGQGVALMRQTWTLTLDGWSGYIPLPGWPVQSVEAIRYLDTTGAEQSLADPAAAFRLVTDVYPARLERRQGVSLPAVLPGPATVRIDYALGRATAAEVDAGLVTALALLAGHYHENREGSATVQVHEIPMGVQHILARYRRGVVG